MYPIFYLLKGGYKVVGPGVSSKQVEVFSLAFIGLRLSRGYIGVI